MLENAIVSKANELGGAAVACLTGGQGVAG